jgi:hypothetical protein
LTNRQVPVNVTQNVDCKLAKKSTSIRIQLNDQAVPTFSKDGPNRLLLTWPVVPEQPQQVRNSSRPPLSNINNRNVSNANGHHDNAFQSQVNGQYNNNNPGNHANALKKPAGPAPPPPIPKRIQSNY